MHGSREPGSAPPARRSVCGGSGRVWEYDQSMFRIASPMLSEAMGNAASITPECTEPTMNSALPRWIRLRSLRAPGAGLDSVSSVASSTLRPAMPQTCRDPFAASSMTAQSRCSSTSLPPWIAHNRPAPPGCARGRARWQPNRVAAFQPNSAARPAQFSPPVKNLLQSLKNWRHRCGGMSVSGRRATPSIQLEGRRSGAACRRTRHRN